MLLDRLKDNGMKTFLLTNSEFWYTEAIMNFLLDFDGVSWGRDGARRDGTGDGIGVGQYVAGRNGTERDKAMMGRNGTGRGERQSSILMKGCFRVVCFLG